MSVFRAVLTIALLAVIALVGSPTTSAQTTSESPEPCYWDSLSSRCESPIDLCEDDPEACRPNPCEEDPDRCDIVCDNALCEPPEPCQDPDSCPAPFAPRQCDDNGEIDDECIDRPVRCADNADCNRDQSDELRSD